MPLEKIYEKLDFIFFDVIGDGEAIQRITTLPIQNALFLKWVDNSNSCSKALFLPC
jgi:hypothetical protein